MKKTTILPFLLVLLLGTGPAEGGQKDESHWPDILSTLEVHGFVEARAGSRIRQDKQEKDISILETRLQGEVFNYTDWADFKFKGDVWADGITEEVEGEVREAWMFARPADILDIKIGRQVLTWGTGNLVFVNDLFPKDWQSYFIGRDKEYLKAPSDSIKISLFSELVNLDVVYTPKFESDRFITGEYLSYWNGTDFCGQNDRLRTDKPDSWFQGDEIAFRLYKNVLNYELAVYGYRGFWKQPAGINSSGQSVFPALQVLGVSGRGQVGPGIGNIEFAYYDSVDDVGGSDPDINNSELRYLVGYSQDLARDLNLSLQYYVEQMLHYQRYKQSLSSETIRDQYRQLLTLQLVWLIMNQNLELNFSGYYSPTDKDAYMRPSMHYKYYDSIILECGLNIFMGEDKNTFFGQFKNNTNIYMALKYSF